MKRLSFRNKILLICGFWMTALSIIGGLMFYNQRTQDRILAELNESRTVTGYYANLLNIMINMETGIRGYLLAGTEEYLEPFNKNEALFDQQLRVLNTDTLSEESKKVLVSIQANKHSWMETASEQLIGKKKFDRSMITYPEFIELFKTGKGKVFSEKVQNEINSVIQKQNARVEELSVTYAHYSMITRWLLMAGLPVAVILGLFFLILMVVKVTKRMSSLAAGLDKLSVGLFGSANEVSAFSKTISNAAIQQAASLQETSAAMVEISSIVKVNSNKALAADKASQESVFVGRATEINIKELVDATHDVKVSSQRISDIVATVDEIAFQTNLLALNASVEAARSGEHGKGFAVVADAIRTLAQRAAKATHQIADIISDNSKKSAISLEKLETNKANVEKLVISLSEIAGLVTEVATGGGQQSKGVDQMTLTLSQIDDALQKNASVSSSSGALVDNLYLQSKELVGVVTSVKEIINGHA